MKTLIAIVLASCPLIVRCQELSWQLRHQLPIGVMASQVFYGNGNFFVPDFFSIATSKDGIEWSQYLLMPPTDERRMFGDGYLYSAQRLSGDEVTWVPFFLTDSGSPAFLANGNGLFVAVREGNIVSSTDGINWVPRALLGRVRPSGVTFGTGLFVMAANLDISDGVGVSTYGMILTSSDGSAWTVRRSERGEPMRNIVYGNGRFLAPTSGFTLVSVDGTKWERLPQSVPAIKFSGGFFTALAETNLLTSVDGASWSTNSIGWAFHLDDVVVGKGTFVVIGRNLIRSLPAVVPPCQIWQGIISSNSTGSVQPEVSLGFYPGISVSGDAGQVYRIDCRDLIAADDQWTTLTNLVLPYSPWLYFDRSGIGVPRRFYRVVKP